MVKRVTHATLVMGGSRKVSPLATTLSAEDADDPAEQEVTIRDALPTDTHTSELAREETVGQIVAYLRHLANGYELMRTPKGSGASEALRAAATKLERRWSELLKP